MEAGSVASGRELEVPGAIARERVGKLVLRYWYTATAVLFVAGLLGLIMRQSQANLAPVSDNFFYAIMTAHGLGAFVAWAGLAIMGFGYWVLQSSGFQMRPLGYALAEITWWCMVLGTAGIIVTTLLMGFAASWVFLYPLPFFAADQWSDAAAGIFSFSVLLAGVAIITWCLAILHTVLGPSLRARSSKLLNRMGVAIGLGLVWPKKFAREVEGPVPYAAIPLTVIAIDMIIATVPLAVLLVIMVIQSFEPSVSVDPLLAKNILWWFGHPVVYLLLFPAVAIYYMLIPRYAKRPLVAGPVLGMAWLLAVIVNVIIWAHHVYIDFPEQTMQAAINLAMQPLTFSISIVSALSLFSLSATMWKSDFQWTTPAKFLAAGIFGWFTAGVSGVVNATIAFDFDVHNTLWIVGHFHHMAFLNIGMVVFAAGYAFLPELTKKTWYSDRLADWHLWTTLIGGYGAFFAWLVQGLLGAPRRFSLLPEQWDAWTIVALPFVALMAVGQLIFLWNLAKTLRGAPPRSDDELGIVEDSRQLGLVSVCALALAVPLFGIGVDRFFADQGESGKKVAPDLRGPAQVFAGSCGGCHTLEAAGSSGEVGPNLDELKPDAALVETTVVNGKGAMPAAVLTGEDAAEVATWVAENAGQ
jgi:cytochrome c oxidase subunit 1